MNTWAVIGAVMMITGMVLLGLFGYSWVDPLRLKKARWIFLPLAVICFTLMAGAYSKDKGLLPSGMETASEKNDVSNTSTDSSNAVESLDGNITDSGTSNDDVSTSDFQMEPTTATHTLIDEGWIFDLDGSHIIPDGTVELKTLQAYGDDENYSFELEFRINNESNDVVTYRWGDAAAIQINDAQPVAFSDSTNAMNSNESSAALISPKMSDGFYIVRYSVPKDQLPEVYEDDKIDISIPLNLDLSPENAVSSDDIQHPSCTVHIVVDSLSVTAVEVTQ